MKGEGVWGENPLLKHCGFPGVTAPTKLISVGFSQKGLDGKEKR